MNEPDTPSLREATPDAPRRWSRRQSSHAALIALALTTCSGAWRVAAQDAKTPRVVVTERVRELGTVMAGDVVPLRWRLENRGDADLIIERTKTTCGCTVVNVKQKDRVIAPGAYLDLEASFQSAGRSGPQEKKVVVFTNDTDTPELELLFRATVDRLFEIIPNQIVNLRNVQRGQTASRTIDVIQGHADVPITDVQIAAGDDAPLSFAITPLAESKNRGHRIAITVTEAAAVGRLSTKASLTIQAGDKQRTRIVGIRANVVGDITWQPTVLDATRLQARAGRKLAPIHLRADSAAAFRVISTVAKPGLDVLVTPAARSEASTRHRITLTVTDAAEPGPFADTLRILTDSPDQPVIEIPVYGFVQPSLSIEPPVIILIANGTPSGTSRRLQVSTFPGQTLEITTAACTLSGVAAAPSRDEAATKRHIAHIQVSLEPSAASEERTGTLMFDTNVPGYERVEIPVTVRPAG